jgi:hypothetical protein
MNSFDSAKRPRRAFSYRSGMRGAPLTLDLLLAILILRQMRLQLELFYPRDITRWN